MYAFAGEKDLAQHWPERAYQDGDSAMVYLKFDPSLTSSGMTRPSKRCYAE